MTDFQTLAFVYGGKFQQTLNDLMSPAKIANTAREFNKVFNAGNPYKMGTWGPQLIDDTGYGGKPLRDGWVQACGPIPTFMQATVELLITNNMTSAAPMPMYFQIQQNKSEPKHQLEIKTTYDFSGSAYIGITILCP